MKKSYLFVGLLALGMMLFQGCEKKPVVDPIDPVNPDIVGEMEELAPSEQKTRLQDVGLEFIDAIKAGTHENLADVIAYMDEADFEEFEIDEDYWDKLEALYQETGYDEEDYYAAARNSNPISAIRGLMTISLNAAQNGAQLAANTDRIYTSTLKAGLKDLYGGFKPDAKYEIWVYDKSITDRLEVEFTDDHNQKWVATLKGSKETTRIHVTGYDKNTDKDVYEGGPEAGTTTETWVYDDEYTLDVPKQITFTVKCNGKAVVDMTVNSSLAFDAEYNEESVWTNYRQWYESDWYYDGGYYGWSDENWTGSYSFKIDYTNLNVDAKLNVNGYEEAFKSNVAKTGISASAEVKIDGKSMLKAEAALNADIDAIVKQANDAANVEDEDEIKLDPKVIKEFTMYVDVMGKVQIVGKCDKFEDLYDAVMDVENAYDEDDFMQFERNINQINGTYSVTIHYDKTETVQANVELEAYEEVYEDWGDEWTDFEVRPILIFAADDSRYSFEDYFTESSFSKLVEEAQDLVEDFENMFERYF